MPAKDEREEGIRREIQRRAMRGNMPFSQKNDFWTPIEVFDALNERFGPFTLDVAASDENKLAVKYFTKDDNGLEQEWTGFIWCNPPYVRQEDGTTIKNWIEKAFASVNSGSAQRALLLIPTYLSNHYWHDTIFPHASHLVFFKSRLDFK